MFLLDDAYLVVNVLHIHPIPENANIVLAAMNIAATNSTVLSDRIEADLAELIQLDLTLAEEMGTSDYAISKLDVIEFEVSQRITGILLRYKMLASRLAAGLNLISLADLTWLNALLQQLGVQYGALETLTLKKAR